jgi:hypothetical protein
MDDDPSGWPIGWTACAGIMMVMGGVWWFISGIVAIANDTFFVVGEEYIFQFDATTWGWIHLILGIIILISGLGLFTANVWARTVGVIVAVLWALVVFAWQPWYPVWAIAFIAVSVFVIWALTVHGRDIADPYWSTVSNGQYEVDEAGPQWCGRLWGGNDDGFGHTSGA